MALACLRIMSFDLMAGSLTALFLFFYLTYALFYPERF